MSDIAIRVENLGKQYRIGSSQAAYRTLRETLVDAVQAPFQRAGRLLQGQASGAANLDETIWALKDVSFEVKQGEVVGIIGRNGAGKSTLLKILSRITEPTTGRAEIHGRVGSLLEVGTGFHPELTGRENIYLNGAILGMTRTEIERKFDEIVAFAEVEKFLDTPVKRYSSGMYVRLAFAVAAHLEPEILLVDEVLAVGDAAFQKKCLGKMGDVAQEGRTVLFVSHNMATVESLCGTTFLLNEGHIIKRGRTSDIIEAYMNNVGSHETVSLDVRKDRKGDGSIRLTSINIDSGQHKPSIRCGDKLHIRLTFDSTDTFSSVVFLIGIYDQLNRPIFFLDSGMTYGVAKIHKGPGVVTCVTGSINLTPGPCYVNVAVLLGRTIVDHIGRATTFNVEADDFYGTGKLTDRKTALCLVQQTWELKP